MSGTSDTESDRPEEATQALPRLPEHDGTAQDGAGRDQTGRDQTGRDETGQAPAAGPRSDTHRSAAPGNPGPGAPAGTDPGATTVLPSPAGGSRAGSGTGSADRSPAPARPSTRPSPRPERAPLGAGARPVAARSRRARLSLRRIDPWSVFLFSLVASVFLGIALIVAVAVLYGVLGRLGVVDSLNQLFAEVTGGSATAEPLLTSGRFVGGAAVLAAVNVVFLTLLATLSSLLYNLCASFTGGLELTFGERD